MITDSDKAPGEGGVDQGGAPGQIQPAKPKVNPVLKEIKALALILLVVFILRSSVFGLYVIPTGSMIPTIKLNDRVIANKLAYGLVLPLMDRQVISWDMPKRGEIVLFKNPSGDETFVKRVIGLPGDTIKFRNGRLMVNGNVAAEEVQADRTVLGEMNRTFDEKTLYVETGVADDPSLKHFILRETLAGRTALDRETYVVPEGRIFCMGDNRDESKDSRFPEVGFIDAKTVYGKALFIFYSTQESTEPGIAGWIPHVRWGRTFSPLK